MPALAPYIPTQLANLANFANNFSTLITANPGLYGLVAADAVTIAAVNSAFSAAYLLALNPSTRTPAAVASRITATVNLLSIVRPYAQQVANNAGVADSDKIALGLNPRTTTPTAIPTPVTNPVLTIDKALTLQHVLRYRDTLASPTSKAKPFGAVQVQIAAMTSATPVTDPTTLPIIASVTKCPAVVSWSSGDAGKLAYYTARWITRTGKVGPWAPIISFTVPA